MIRWWMRGPLMEDAPAAAGGGSVPGLPPPPSDDSDITRLAASVAQQGETLNRLINVVRNIPSVQPPPEGRRNSPQQSGQPPAPAQSPQEQEFWRDPVGVTQSITRQAIAERDAQTAAQPSPAFDTLVSVARSQARDREPRIFDLLSTEIARKVMDMPPQFHQSATVWSNAFNMAVGENLDRVLAERAKASGGAAQPAGAAVGGPSAPSPKAAPAPKEPDLTQDQKDFYTRFGLNETEYRRGIKRLAEQGSGRPNEPSSWDEVITFDSDKKRRDERRKKEQAHAGAA